MPAKQARARSKNTNNQNTAHATRGSGEPGNFGIGGKRGSAGRFSPFFFLLGVSLSPRFLLPKRNYGVADSCLPSCEGWALFLGCPVDNLLLLPLFPFRGFEDRRLEIERFGGIEAERGKNVVGFFANT